MRELLVRFYDQGDEEAIQRFVERTGPPLLKAARRMAPRFAEDAVQAAYLSLLRNGNVPPRPIAWLMTAVIRISYRHVAKETKERVLAQRLAREAPARDTDLRDEIDRLPTKYRDAIVLHYFERLTAAEAGRLMGCSDQAVRQRLHRARAMLRTRLSYGLFGLFVLGDVMKRNLSAVAVLILLLGGGVAWHAWRPSTPAEREAGRTARREAVAEPGGDDEVETNKSAAFASGVVVDSSMAPVAGVRVLQRGLESIGPQKRPEWIRVHPPRQDEAGETVTDADGRFELTRPIDELQTLVFLKPGYMCTEAAAQLGMRVVLAAGRLWRGKVVDTSGAPIGNVAVAAWQGKDRGAVPLCAYTDAAGEFSFASLGPTIEMAMVSAPGYDHRNLQGTGEWAEIRLMRNSVIVDVADAAGAPVRATGLLLGGDEGTFRGATRYTFGNDSVRATPGRLIMDRWRIYDLPVHGELLVIARGFRTHREPLKVEEREEPPHLRVRLQRGEESPTVAGRVEGPGGATVELRAAARDPSFSLSYRHHPLLFRIETVGGKFAFPRVPALRYKVRVVAPGFAQHVVDVHAPQTDLVIRPPAACVLEVTIQDHDGSPAAQHWVHVGAEESQRDFWHGQTDGAGFARFVQLPPGKMHVYPFRFHAGLDPRNAGMAEFATVSPDAVSRVTITLPRKVDYTLHVRSNSGVALVRVPLHITVGRGYAGFTAKKRSWTVETDAGGEAKLTVFPGEYQVKATASGTTRTFLFEVTAKGGESEFRLPTSGITLEGTVTDLATGKPVADRWVGVASADLERSEGWLGKSVTDAAGRYEIVNLPAGKLALHIRANSGGGRQGEAAEAPYPSAHKEFTVQAGVDHTLDVALPRILGPDALSRTTPITLVVRDAETGAPLNGALAYARGRTNGLWIACGMAKTGEDGTGKGTLIDAERYRITVFGPFGAKVAYAPKQLQRDTGAVTIDVALAER